MTENKLLTREEILKENFNNIKIDTKDVKKFLVYFGGILELGISEGLIDEAVRNVITTAITNAIEYEASKYDYDDEFDTNYIQLRNYMYVISSYLQSKSNWDAWLELVSIKSTKDAIVLISNASKWLTDKLNSCFKLLNDLKLSIKKININNLTITYNTLISTVKSAMSSTSDTTEFDIQYSHNSYFNAGTYVLINQEKDSVSSNFFQSLYNIVKDFCMEVSILVQIDAKKIIRSKEKEAQDYYINKFDRYRKIDDIYTSKLSEIQNNSSKKKKFSNCNEYFEELSNIQKELEENYQKADEEAAMEEILQVEILCGEYCLYDLIKEYAIYSLASQGNLVYPSTLEERAKMLAVIDFKEATLEFISGNQHLLTSEQIDFLEKV